MTIDPLSSVTASLITDRNARPLAHHRDAEMGQTTEAHTTLKGSSAAVASLVAQAMSTPAVRQEKVDALKALIADGAYSIDRQKIASAMLTALAG